MKKSHPTLSGNCSFALENEILELIHRNRQVPYDEHEPVISK